MTVIKLFHSFLFCILCCTAAAQTDPATPAAPYKQKDTSYWVENFRQFRDALYKKDRPKVKAFIDFPVKNESNEIWYLAYSGDEKALDKLGANTKPFTEKDLDRHFSRVFTKQLSHCFLKIKLDELFKKGEAESPELKDSSTTYTLFATYNKKEKTIELNLATKTAFKIEGSNEYETTESNYIYYFTILPNGHIKFKKIMIAG